MRQTAEPQGAPFIRGRRKDWPRLALVTVTLVVAASLAAGCGDSGPKDYELTQDFVRAHEGICRIGLPLDFRAPSSIGARTLDDIAYAGLRGDVVMEVLKKQNRREPTPQQYELLEAACMRGFNEAMRKLRDQWPDGYQTGAGLCRGLLTAYRSQTRSGLPTPAADAVGLDPSDPLGSAVNVRAFFVENGGYEGAPIEYADAYAVGCYEVVSGSVSDGAGTDEVSPPPSTTQSTTTAPSSNPPTTATAFPRALPDHLVGEFQALADQQMRAAGKVFYCSASASNTLEVCLYGTRTKIQGGFKLARVGPNCYRLSHTDPSGVPIVTRTYSGSDFDRGSAFYDISSSDWHANNGYQVAGC